MNCSIKPESPSADFIPPGDWEDLITQEKAALASGRTIRRKVDGDQNWTGLALSGGGIRAATFALGAIQALAAKRVLKQIDYISSVSGGGYIASSLQWSWSNARSEEEKASQRNIKDAPGPARFGLDQQTFPYGTSHLSGDPTGSAEQQRNLKYLRNHGYYLTPGKGLDTMALIAVVLRTVFLSLLVWVPLTILAFVLIDVIDQSLLLKSAWLKSTLWQELKDLIGTIIPVAWDSATQCKEQACALRYRPIYAIMFGLWLLTLIIFAGASLLLGLVSRAADNASTRQRVLKMALAGVVAVLSICLWRQAAKHNWSLDTALKYSIAAIFFVLSISTVFFQLFPSHSSNWSYLFRRNIEKLLGVLFIPSAVLLAVSTIPLPGYFLFHYVTESGLKVATLVGPLSAISGAISALYGYYTVLEKSEPGLAGRIFAPIGAAVFIYGMLTTSYFVGIICFEATALESPTAPFFTGSSTRLVAQIIFLCIIVVSLILLLSVNINYVGLHRFYRDRLLETFMPSFKAIQTGQVRPSYAADRLRLSGITAWSADEGREGSTGPVPYPIINSFVGLSKDSNPTTATRGGANFILSPLYIGCDATGWLRTERYEQRFGPQTLASAMAASGAAINSNAGYVGTGITRNKLVSFVMTLLNMRLGIWTGNPLNHRNYVRRVPTFLSPLLVNGLLRRIWNALLRNKSNNDGTFLELSDGGNFENLGIYELVRRRLSAIVVVDAEADGTLGLPAFVSAVQRVQEDFGARVEFVISKGPERFIPMSVQSPIAYPAGASFAASPFLVANIQYEGGLSGVIVYLKATLIKDLEFLTYGYRAKYPTFPHQSTVDQFFDPGQFEAYRDLGYRSAAIMCDSLDLENTINDVAKLRAKYDSKDQTIN